VFRVLFLDEGGEARAMETNVEFTDKIAHDGIAGKPQILSRVLDTDIISLSGDEIKLAAIIEMDLFDNVSTRVKFLRFGGEDVFSREEKLDYSKLTARIGDAFTLSDEAHVTGNKLLLVESALVLFNVSSGADNVAADGEIITNIVTESDGEMNSYRLVTPFSHEAPAEGSRGGNEAIATVRLRSVKASFAESANTEAGEGEAAVNQTNILYLSFEAELTGFVYGEDSAAFVSDAFSIQNELSLVASEAAFGRSRKQRTVTERVEGSVTLSSDMPVADRILAMAGSRLSIANSYIQDERLTIEGTVNAAVIYFSAETGTKNSVDVELPFSISTSEASGGAVAAAYGEVYEITARIRRATEIDIRAEIAVTVNTLETTKVRLITELNVGEIFTVPSAAISMHIARPREALWDVAKALRTTPELILLQNPELQLPLRGGERVIIYRHLKK
ncbi:MAG: hypothetical protein FWE84_02450, partial [Firmicutes bacterium]|nr:hypothetical protein [Bacillota bacterium]